MSSSRTAFVFGYGSLAGEESSSLKALEICHADGLRRTWNVAMDNTLTLPNYKFYVDEAGARRSVFVTFLNIVEDLNKTINGVLIPVSVGDLANLDARERNYDRLDISDRIVEPVDGQVWGYIGTLAARRRYEEGVRRRTAVVDNAYYAKIRQQFGALGRGALSEFLASTDEPTCPRVNLARFDL
jgi:hypothetical protein